MYRYELYDVNEIERLRQELCAYKEKSTLSNEVKFWEDYMQTKNDIYDLKFKIFRIEGEMKTMEKNHQEKVLNDELEVKNLMIQMTSITKSLHELQQQFPEITKKISELFNSQHLYAKEQRGEFEKLNKEIFQIKELLELNTNNKNDSRNKKSEYRQLKGILQSPTNIEQSLTKKKNNQLSRQPSQTKFNKMSQAPYFDSSELESGDNGKKSVQNAKHELNKNIITRTTSAQDKRKKEHDQTNLNIIHSNRDTVSIKNTLNKKQESQPSNNVGPVMQASQSPNVGPVMQESHPPKNVGPVMQASQSPNVGPVMQESHPPNNVGSVMQESQSPNNAGPVMQESHPPNNAGPVMQASQSSNNVSAVMQASQSPNVAQVMQESQSSKNVSPVMQASHPPNNVSQVMQESQSSKNVGPVMQESHPPNNVSQVMQESHSPNNVGPVMQESHPSKNVGPVMQESQSSNNVPPVMQASHPPKNVGSVMQESQSPNNVDKQLNHADNKINGFRQSVCNDMPNDLYDENKKVNQSNNDEESGVIPNLTLDNDLEGGQSPTKSRSRSKNSEQINKKGSLFSIFKRDKI